MAEEESTATVRCPNCGQMVSDIELQTCPMCRSVFCQQCAAVGYGRVFCGIRCRDMFFFGDGDEPETEF